MKPVRHAQTLLLFSLIVLSLSSAQCPTSQKPDEKDPCRAALPTILDDKKSVNPGEAYYLEAPPAENTCHGTYTFEFRFKDDGLAVLSDKMPVIDNLDKGFRPAGEFSYFPHGSPVMSVRDGIHYWTIQFDAGNKHSGFPSTEHSISVYVPTVQENPEAQPVLINATIEYYPKQVE